MPRDVFTDRTGKRSVLSFLLSPVARATSEAGRGR